MEKGVTRIPYLGSLVQNPETCKKKKNKTKGLLRSPRSFMARQRKISSTRIVKKPKDMQKSKEEMKP